MFVYYISMWLLIAIEWVFGGIFFSFRWSWAFFLFEYGLKFKDTTLYMGTLYLSSEKFSEFPLHIILMGSEQ